MNKFCKSSLCVENVRESNVLICRRLVDVPGVDVLLGVSELVCVETIEVIPAACRSQCWKDSGAPPPRARA